MVDNILQQRKLVLEVNYVSNQTGRHILVNSDLNFVRVDTSMIFQQVASNSEMLGPNGMGGISTGGNIDKWEVRRFGKDK